MKDMNWPERVAYLENQLADSDRDNQRLRGRLAETEALRKDAERLAEFDRAADFYRRCKADPRSHEVGAMRDAVEWLCQLAAMERGHAGCIAQEAAP